MSDPGAGMRHFQSGETIEGRYRLTQPLAKGGMGAVWKAWDTQLDVPVAVKFMAPEAIGSTELIARFEREAKAAAQLRSPNVVLIYGHGVFDGTPFMAMELLEGEDLGKHLKARGRLSLAETARIAGDVCKALRKAHDMGVVHRDLKPANIFLCRGEDEEIVKVLDFGIAKVNATSTAGEVTKTGALLGTPHYMSPEQARRTNRKVDHRSDLWALAVIVFRALTGKLPFPGDDAIDVLVRICTTAPPSPSSIAPDLGSSVDAFFLRALAFDPDQRFQSARELADALHALSGRPVNPLHQSWSGGAPPGGGAPAAGPVLRPSSPSFPAVSPGAAAPPMKSPRSGTVPIIEPAPLPGQRSPHTGTAPMLQAVPRPAEQAPRPPPPAPPPPPAGASAKGPAFADSSDPITLMPDSMDVAQTVPIQKSVAAQALLQAAQQRQAQAAQPARPATNPQPAQAAQPARPATNPQPAQAAQPARPATNPQPASMEAPAGFGGTLPLMTPVIKLPAPDNRPKPAVRTQQLAAPLQAPVPAPRQGPAGAATRASSPEIATQPLPPAAAAAARGSYADIAAPPTSAPATTSAGSAGDSAGTITSAAGELPAMQSRRRASPVVLAATIAAVLTVLIVVGVIATALSESADTAPTAAPSATAAPTVTPSATATGSPSPTVTAAPSATATASAKVPGTAAPGKSPAPARPTASPATSADRKPRFAEP